MKTAFIDLDGTTFTLKNFFKTKNFYNEDSDMFALLNTIPLNIVFVTSRTQEQVFETNNKFILKHKILFNDKFKNIKEYVNEKNITDYVLIDDDKNLKYMFPGRTVIIDWFNGFTIRDFFEVLRILKYSISFKTDKGVFYLDLNNLNVSFEKIKALLKASHKTPNLNILEANIYEPKH